MGSLSFERYWYRFNTKKHYINSNQTAYSDSACGRERMPVSSDCGGKETLKRVWSY